jgi:ferredoxin like protein
MSSPATHAPGTPKAPSHAEPLDGPTTATKPRTVPLPESPLKQLPVANVKARLGSTKFVTDAHDFQHITVDPDVCGTCPHTMCVNTCPAQCFEFQNGRMQFTYEDCVECGTCDIVCTPGSVKWNNPRAGFGVQYRYG